MKAPNRDILVLVKDHDPDSPVVQQELELLNHLLLSVETMNSLCRAHEVLDLNRFERSSQFEKVYRLMRDRNPKPFIFLFNRN
ncbi:MAG: hypothetical protein RL732_316 [Bacteroidota bacterium]|jgi:hypothetical protein